MNRVYTYVFTIIILVVNILPRTSMAQCNCSPGHPATPIDYSVTIPVTSASSTTVSFPKFNPSVGNLACLTVKDTVSATTTTNALNKAPDSTLYKFQLTVSDDLSGPGIDISNTFNKVYGPDSLAPLGTPGDAITYGPDVIYSNLPGTASKTAPSALYLGSSGTIDFTYSLSGGVVSTQGGLNYTAGPTTTYSGIFHLTYYWCPSTPLATGIEDFTASPDGSTVLLTWSTPEQQPNTQYEIQVSTDGSNFYSIGKTESTPATAGLVAKHQYQYDPDPAYVGKLYFRIEETNAYGKVSYSTILIIDPGGGSDKLISYRAYPNPATNHVIFQFNRNQTGRFLVELVNTSGMVVQQRAVALAGTSQIRLDLNPQPVKGLYFLRTTDLSHSQKYVSKVFIE
ncbi:MAG TPA: choice-of-anchor E domain-containing protein [Puia sp.]